MLCAMFRYFPDFCVLDSSECWNFQDVCASCAQPGFLFWALKNTGISKTTLELQAPKVAGISRTFVLAALTNAEMFRRRYAQNCWNFLNVCVLGTSSSGRLNILETLDSPTGLFGPECTKIAHRRSLAIFTADEGRKELRREDHF